MSGESLPLLSHAVPSFKTIIIQWEHLQTSAPHCMPFIDVGLVTARDYYQCMGRTSAYAIAMCTHYYIYVTFVLSENITVVDPTIHLTWIKVNWSNNKVIRVKGRIIDLVCLVLLIVPHSNIHPR